ncbi:Serine-arginine protein 55 [Temnothorax longispinosus]|uniref:Serine-arginine protein 55 n=1 Tax=Temnothorax longispinosus TaxID=300112 RepID=A0A4S2KQT1_9HYME|nr:Serine-arginine protein 55 [Temnothorax longispinosus]
MITSHLYGRQISELARKRQAAKRIDENFAKHMTPAGTVIHVVNSKGSNESRSFPKTGGIASSLEESRGERADALPYPASVPAGLHGGYHDTLTVHNLNAQSEYYTMQPAPGPSPVCRYGAFTYGRIGTHDKSMFGLPLCQMPGERKMEEGDTDKENERNGRGEVRGRERERKKERDCCLYAVFTVSRLAIPTIPYRSEIFRSRSSSPVIDTCAHRRSSKVGSRARRASSLTSPPVCAARRAKKLRD